MDALTSVSQKMWPGVPVIPIMEPGASDSIYTMIAGIPSYGINGVAIDRDDVRMHGKDERVKVDSYYSGVEFYYVFLKALTTRSIDACSCAIFDVAGFGGDLGRRRLAHDADPFCSA